MPWGIAWNQASSLAATPVVVPQAADVTAIDDIGKASEVAPKASAPTGPDTAAEANALAGTIREPFPRKQMMRFLKRVLEEAVLNATALAEPEAAAEASGFAAETIREYEQHLAEPEEDLKIEQDSESRKKWNSSSAKQTRGCST